MTDFVPTTWLLAIDTSTSWTGIALTDGAFVDDYTWEAARQQTTTVLVEIERLMGMHALTPTNLGAIAVATGPGSFSGLRVGMSIAKGVALARDIPVVGVPTLHATHELDLNRETEIAAIRAGRARYVWTRASDPDTFLSGSLDDLIAAVLNSAVPEVIGEIEHGDRAILIDRGVGLIGLDSPITRVKAIAQIGWLAWQRGAVSDLATLEPIYVHGTGRIS